MSIKQSLFFFVPIRERRVGGQPIQDKIPRFRFFDGVPKDLPNLNKGRKDHGCGHYYSRSNELVQFNISINNFVEYNIQFYLVTGGYDINHRLSSTEVISSVSGGWKYVGELPGPRYGLRGITLANKIFVTGCFNPETSENKPCYSRWIKWNKIFS